MLVSLLYTLLTFLIPLGLYCLFLAWINRRPRPTLVHGSWDMVGVFVAASGFLLVTIPSILAQLYQRFIGFEGVAGGTFDEIWSRWWLLWLVYFLLVVVGGVFLVLARKFETHVYNVDPEQFAAILQEALRRLGMDCCNSDGRLLLGPADAFHVVDHPLRHEPTKVMHQPPSVEQFGELEFESFHTFCHLVVHWHNTTVPLRRKIEVELNKLMEQTEAPDNPAGAWLLGVSSTILLLNLMITAFLTMHIVMLRR